MSTHNICFHAEINKITGVPSKVVISGALMCI